MTVTGQLLLQRAAEAAERDSANLTALDGRSLKLYLDFALGECWQHAPWPSVCRMLELPHAAGAITKAVSETVEIDTFWAVWDRDWREDARAMRLAAVDRGTVIQLLPEAIPADVLVVSGEIEADETYHVVDDAVIYNGTSYAADATFVGVEGVTTFTGLGAVYLCPQVWVEFSLAVPDLLALPDVAVGEETTFAEYELPSELGRALPLMAAAALLGIEGKAAMSAMLGKLARQELERQAKPVWNQRARFHQTTMIVP